MESNNHPSSSEKEAHPLPGAPNGTESAHQQAPHTGSASKVDTSGPSHGYQPANEADTGGEGETGHSTQDDASTGEDMVNSEDTASAPRTEQVQAQFLRLL
ncbi:hypothetical protein B0H65DRAFT_419422 [Neurospora tetraspora]|uniref:Uncharacterized protein n=1 Tax=Neurospora tetraspora TaxID=94610 RepID=A0AAE0MTF0_9PEZI|nr:hypothetical protein B0H65DRAFT_419422 [Neurospora tetraspora]